MILTTRYFYLDLKEKSKQFILTTTIKRIFGQFCLEFKIIRIKTSDEMIISRIKQQCDENSTQSTLLDKIDNEIVNIFIVKYKDFNSFLTELANQAKTFLMSNMESNQIIFFQVFDSQHQQYNLPITIKHARILYNDINSLYKNYLLFDSMYKLIINKSNKNFGLQKETSIPKKIESIRKLQNKQPVFNTNNITKNSFNECDQILSLSINKIIGTSLLKQVFDYYRFIKKSDYEIKIDKQKTIICIPNILPTNYIFNTNYFRSLALSNNDIELDRIKLYSIKIIQNLINSEINKNPLYVMMLTYLFFIYLLRYIYISHTQFYIMNSDEIINNPQKQEKLLNHLISVYFNDYTDKISFSILNKKITMDNETEDHTIDFLGEKYKHLIHVDQQKFLELILNNLEVEDPSFTLNINDCKILNIKDLIKNETSTETIFPTSQIASNIIKTDLILESELFNYNSDNFNKQKPISIAYQFFLDYINNPATILNIKDNIVPKTIIKLFEVLKDIINTSNFNKSNISTLSYYQILCKLIPNSINFSHTIFLYIVYQIIIPYMYDLYGIHIYEDCLI